MDGADPKTSLMDSLATAAARGVEVTIITNAERDPVKLARKWTFKETAYGDRGEFRGAGYFLTAQDCDGDFSTWRLERHGARITGGETHGHEPVYHFDAALLAAEAALAEELAR